MPAHRTIENQGIVATESRHTVEGMARGERKKKKPPTKKEKPLLAAPLAYGRLRRPQPSHASSGLSLPRSRRPRFLWAAPPPHTPLLAPLPSAAAPPPFLALSALLSPLVGGCAAPPLCFSSRASFGRLRRPTPSASPPLLLRFSSASSAAAPPHSPPRSRGRLAPPPLSPLSFLSIKKLTNP